MSSETWNKVIDLTIAVDRGSVPRLLKSPTNASEAPELNDLVAGDTVLLRIWLARLPATTGGTPTNMRLATGSEIAFAADAAQSPDGTMKFLADTFTEVAVGDAPDTVYHYEGVLDLNNATLLAIMDGRTSPLQVTCEVLAQTATDDRRRRLQFPGTIQKRVFGGQPPPPAGEPTYPLPSKIVQTQSFDNAPTLIEGTSLTDITAGEFDLAPGKYEVIHKLLATWASSPVTGFKISLLATDASTIFAWRSFTGNLHQFSLPISGGGYYTVSAGTLSAGGSRVLITARSVITVTALETITLQLAEASVDSNSISPTILSRSIHRIPTA